MGSQGGEHFQYKQQSLLPNKGNRQLCKAVGSRGSDLKH